MKNTHGRTIHPCDKCSYTSKRPNDLRRHKLNKHEKKDPNKHASQAPAVSDQSVGNLYILCLSQQKMLHDIKTIVL